MNPKTKLLRHLDLNLSKVPSEGVMKVAIDGVDGSGKITFARMSIRDGCTNDLKSEANRRYIDGPRNYLSDCDPKNLATVVINNTDFENPKIVSQKGP